MFWVLASESPRRRQLLTEIIPDFLVQSADVTEILPDSGLSGADLASRNAAMKSDAVARIYPEAWVLGADTVVCMDGKVYGKPRDHKEAISFLQSFSGRTHEVITAVSLRQFFSRKSVDFIALSTVQFRVLTTEIIEKYLSLVPVLDKAGAYGIQEYGEMLVESYTGELENIIGLPTAALAAKIAEMGITAQQ